MVKRINCWNILTYILISSIYFLVQARSATLDCTFDDDFCAWRQDDSDEFNWTRNNWGTGSWYTGPNSDHTSGDWKGYYIYIEADWPRQTGVKAKLISPVQEPGTYCFMFWYNMYGRHIGKLNVYTKPNYTVIFTRSGDIGDADWRSAAISYNDPTNFQIVIEGIRGQGTEVDIAIDDISMAPGLCKTDCTFDDGLCHWKQDTTDDFDWTRRKGRIRTPGTGPPADHTSGNGFYIYIETNGYVRNKRARVISPFQRSGKYCFSFWYYMFGQHVDTLRVLIKDEQGKETKVFKIAGEQGQKWIHENVEIYSALRFSIIIEGKVMNSVNHYYGEIAIDDIRMLPCQDCVNPAPLHGTTNSTNFQHGSAIEVICDYGYYLRGASSIVCQTGGTWSAYPTCDPVVCENPKPPHGKANSTTFFYSSVIEITCDEGFSVTGKSVISCQADGEWTDATTCSLIDCGSREIVNGEFRAVSGTTYGKTATQSCNKGYVFTGDAAVECGESGWNGSAATCKILDCLEPLTDNGMMSESTKNTTYNQTVEIVCVNGYNLLGNATVTCQANGNWTSSPICVIKETENNSALIAVYVLVPVAAVVLVIALFVLIWRKHVIRCLPVSDANPERDMKKQPNEKTRPIPLFSNVTYTDHHDKLQSNQGDALSQDTEYAIITDDRNGKLQDTDPVYYNTAGAVMAEKKNVKHNYDHVKTSATPVFDKTYAHISEDEGNNESHYDTTSVQYPGNVSLRTNAISENNDYDVLNIKDSKHVSGLNSQSSKLEDPYSEYDHATAGGIDPVDQVDLDDYSHLNDTIVKPVKHVKSTESELNMLDNDVYSSIVKNTKRNDKTDEAGGSVYEKAIGKTPQCFDVEGENDGTGEDDRHYFVLEKE